MPIQILMPQLGESVSEGVVARWLKKVGEHVEKDEPLVEVTTDKVNAEIPAVASGVLRRISVQEGETVAVGSEIALLEELGESARAVSREPAPAEPAQAGPARSQVEQGLKAAEQAPAEIDIVAARQRTSPLVRRLAQEHRVDLAAVQGSGLNGRVTKEDVMAYLDRRTAVPPRTVEAVSAPAQPATAEGDQPVPLTPVRRMIAEHMARSKASIPHATTFMEVDMTALVRRRAQLREEFRRREGFELTYLPFAVQAAIEALRQFPILNAQWANDKIMLKRRINVGVAVALEDGLVVPVIHDAGHQSVTGLARAIRDLSEKARVGKLTLDDVQGGTFTVNNPGAFGTVLSLPIINAPQAGILTMDAVVKRPVVVQDDAIAVRSMMFLGLAFDHRVVDGLTAGRFLSTVKSYLELTAPNAAI